MRGGGGRLGRGMEEWRKEEGGEAREKARSSEETGERKRGGVEGGGKGRDEGEIANGERS